MFKRFIKARSVLLIFALGIFVALPAQTTKADAASCAQAVADQAAAQAEMRAACSGEGGSSSGMCKWWAARLAQLVATTADECT